MACSNGTLELLCLETGLGRGWKQRSEATLDGSESVPRAFTLCSAWGEALSGMLRESDIVCRFGELAVSLEKGKDRKSVV